MSTTTTRSAERTEFLSDVIITAIEGGVNDWAQVSQYQYVDRGVERLYIGEPRPGGGTRATIHKLNDDETGYEAEELNVDVEIIATGLSRIRSGETPMNDSMRTKIVEADRENEAGSIDAYDASAIVQAGLFGKLVFG